MKRYLKSLIPLSLTTFASTYGGNMECQQMPPPPKPCQPRPSCAVFLDSPSYDFEVDFCATLLQPTASNLHYAAEAFPLPAPSPHWKIFDIHPAYHFGCNLEAAAIFHKPNTSLRANWEYFNSKDHSIHKHIPSSDMIGPFFEIGPDAAPYKNAHGWARFHFEAANLDYGVFVNFGKRLKTNLYSGIGYAHIKETLFSVYSDDSGAIKRTIKTPSKFSGAGPQLGATFSYRIAGCFHITGEGTMSFLVGPLKNHTTYTARSPLLPFVGVTPPNVQTTKGHSRTQVVPSFAGNLGLSFSTTFCDCVMVMLEGGYEVQLYLNAIQSTDIGSEVVTPPIAPDTVGVFARTFQRNLSNFALAGPYLTLNIGF